MFSTSTLFFVLLGIPGNPGQPGAKGTAAVHLQSFPFSECFSAVWRAFVCLKVNPVKLDESSMQVKEIRMTKHFSTHPVRQQLTV